MAASVAIIICSLLYTSTIAVIYFSKKKINNMENRIYSFLISINIVGLIIELLCCYFVYNRDIYSINNFINILINKTFLIYFFIWVSTFTIYFFLISFGDKPNFNEKIKKRKKTISFILTIMFMIITAIIVFLPLYYVSDGTYVYSYGPATNFISLIAGVSIILDFIFLFINFKNINKRKYYPLFIFVVLIIVILFIREINPGLTILNSILAFTTILMYFTIENPDVKLIKELNENRELVEKTNEEKSNLLFKISQDLRNPVSYIYEESESLLNEKDSKKIETGIRSINNSSRRLSYMINNVLNVSNMDSKNIKVVNNKYNIYTVLEEIKTRVSDNVREHVDFRFNISNIIPESLYGDPIKIRQVISTILSNSIKHTNKGFVELNIDSLIKYDVCRLIITIEDSGEGMNLSKVNDLLRLDEELTEEDNEKLGKLDMDLNLCKKLIKSLGGNLMIKSEEEKGSEFIIVLDQKIDEIKDDSANKYAKMIFNKKRILIVDDDIDEIENISGLFKKKGIDVTTSLYGKDAYDKINSGIDFDLIIIDDEMPDMSGVSTLQEIKKINNFKIPAIVMLDKDKLRIKQTYLDDGFKNYLDKSKLNSSIDKIVEEYL